VHLMVDNKPFLVRGGELANSVASSLNELNAYWEKFRQLNMNTVVAPVYWDLIEPAEGRFDFTLVDGLIRAAEKNNMKLVLLWFGSWKNSMSSYCPEWVKVDFQRFPRARNRDGRALEILSPFHEANYQSDAKAFRALMKHIRQIDKKSTVIMVQPENEIGMVESAREYSEKANQAYQSAVPAALMQYLIAHRQNLTPELMALWRN
jgi:Beta-galactosidase